MHCYSKPAPCGPLTVNLYHASISRDVTQILAIYNHIIPQKFGTISFYFLCDFEAIVNCIPSSNYTPAILLERPLGQPEVVTCRLTVAALEGADSGEIGCKIEQENIEVFKELTVFGKCSKVGVIKLRLLLQYRRFSLSENYVVVFRASTVTAPTNTYTGFWS